MKHLNFLKQKIWNNQVSPERNSCVRRNLQFRLFLLSITLLSCIPANAQDIITLRSGEQIEARVTEISPSELRYKRFDNIDGPTRVVAIADVFAINYENGTREVINPFTPVSATQTQAAPTQQTQGQPAQQQWQTAQTPSQQTQERQNRPQTVGNAHNTRGETAIGVNALVGIEGEYVDFGFGAKILHNISPLMRLAPEINILWNTSSGGFGGVSYTNVNRFMSICANTHIVLPLPVGNLYSLVGIGWANLNVSVRASALGGSVNESVSESVNFLVIPLGVGFEYISKAFPKLSLVGESKLKFMFTDGNSGSRLYVGGGIKYKF